MTVEQDETQLRVVVPIEEEEDGYIKSKDKITIACFRRSVFICERSHL
jgi:hypothetical protein